MMELFKKDFEESVTARIDENGVVVLNEESYFEPHKLFDLEDGLYDNAFQRWVSDERQNRLYLATKILSIKGNRHNFQALKTVYDNGKVIPFVGAGLSMPSGYSGWTDFLKDLAEEYEINIDEFIKKGEYEEAAYFLEKELGENSFDNEIENRFGYHENIKGAVRLLPIYGKKQTVITSNFDNIIKECFEECDASFDEYILGTDVEDISRYLSQGKNCLIKIHGKATSRKDRILTTPEYSSHYGSEGCLTECIKQISTSQSLLFLGCSLSVDRTIQVMHKLTEKFNSKYPRHYAFLKKPKKNIIKRKKELAKANIFPIFYECEDDKAICALLEKLMN